MAESRPGLKFSEAPFGGLHDFSKQFLGEVGESKYRDPWARRIWEKYVDAGEFTGGSEGQSGHLS